MSIIMSSTTSKMMSYPKKRQRLDDSDEHDAMVTTSNLLASFGALSVDELANILEFLPLQDFMRSRRINKKTMEAVKKTIVPLTDFCVDSVENYNAMAVMTEALPNLQQITLRGLGGGNKWSDGEDPNESHPYRTANWTSHNIGIISNFRKLCYLKIDCADLNGRYSVLFNSFPLLQKLYTRGCSFLKWDLEMLAGMPMLKELMCTGNDHLTGNINSLRVLKDTLETVIIFNCENVEGNFMDLADFPHLKVLNLGDTAVTGDIRDINTNDFSSLENLYLPKGVYGGSGYELQRISDAPDLVRAVYLLKKKRPTLLMLQYWFEDWCGVLSEDSTDWYDSVELDYFSDPPFSIHFVQAGSRIGYRWVDADDANPCEVNWLDSEPERDSIDYGKYIEELQKIEAETKVGAYRGFHEPPTEAEYYGLIPE